MIPKVSSKTRVAGMTISSNVSFGLSCSRLFTESARSSCIPGLRNNSNGDGDCNDNDDKSNNGTCGGDDRHMVKPLLKWDYYVEMRSHFESQKAVLEEFGLSSDEYLNLSKLYESKRMYEVLWKEDLERAKKAIELWKQERHQKQAII
ncbi:hypothetical protein BGX26_002292 [Mortierella sp. AD094]|nr:hypothetical protein BGX26_002292 [Mortierella sp. AD094]